MNDRLRSMAQKIEKTEGHYRAAEILGVAPVTLRAFLLGAPSRAGTVALIEKNVKIYREKK